MDTNTIILVVEAVAIAALSAYSWYAVYDDEATAKLWIALFLLAVVVIGFALTLWFDPLMFG